MRPFQTGRHAAILALMMVGTGCASNYPHGSATRSSITRESEFTSTGESDRFLTNPPHHSKAAHAERDSTAAGSEIQTVQNSEDNSLSLVSAELAPESPSGGETSQWSLDVLESIALQQNPAVLQASASAHKAMGYRNQVGRKPNPLVGYQGSQLADRGTDQHVAFIEQDIVLGDKLQKNERVLSQEIQSQLWEVETQRFRVLTDVRQRFYEALAAQRRIELATEFEVVAAQGVSFAESRMTAKEGTRPEVLQAEIQLKQIQLQRQQADAAFTGAWKRLMATAGMPVDGKGNLAGQLPSSVEPRDWDGVKAQMLSSSPELQGARARLSRARANVDRQNAQAIPNVSLLVGAGRDNGTGSGMLNTQIGIPLPVHNRNEGNIAAAQAEFCRASQDVRRTELSIESRLAEAIVEFESASAAVDQYQLEILPRAKETLSLAEQAYKAGEFDFLQVLVARKTFFDANLEFVTSQLNLAKASVLLDGQVLTGGLDSTRDTEFDSGLRDQALSGQ